MTGFDTPADHDREEARDAARHTEPAPTPRELAWDELTPEERATVAPRNRP